MSHLRSEKLYIGLVFILYAAFSKNEEFFRSVQTW